MAGNRGPSLMERHPPDPRGKHILVYWFMPGYSYVNILALGYFLYPLAVSPEQLIAFRVVVAVGAAILPVMLGASLIDIIQECSRGRWLGTTSIFNGLGVILMSIVFGQLPERFEWMGFSGALAGKYTFWIAAAVGIVSAILLRLGFKGGPPAEVKEKPSVLKNLARGITEARRNPRIALASTPAASSRAATLWWSARSFPCGSSRSASITSRAPSESCLPLLSADNWWTAWKSRMRPSR